MGLFSTHTHTHKTTLVPYEKSVTVHEHRAPTDASLRMLNEMQEKVKQNIIDSMIIQTNEMNAVAVFHTLSMIDNAVLWDAAFVLNGNTIRINGKIDYNEWVISTIGSKELVVERIAKCFLESVSKEMVMQILPSIMNQMNP